MDKVFILMSEGCCGIGPTPEQATHHYRRQGGRRPGDALMWEFDERANPRATEDGYITFRTRDDYGKALPKPILVNR